MAKRKFSGWLPEVVKWVLEKLASQTRLGLDPEIFVEIPLQRRRESNAVALHSHRSKGCLDRRNVKDLILINVLETHTGVPVRREMGFELRHGGQILLVLDLM